MMHYKKVIIGLCMFIMPAALATMMPLGEDAYVTLAPQPVIDVIGKAATTMEFKGVYEVGTATKAGMQVNPWNRFISYGINPQTTRPFVIVNPTWFETMPEDQQAFLAARCFALFEHGTMPLSMKIIPYLFVLFNLLFIFLFVRIVRKTRFAHVNVWLIIVVAWLTLFVCNTLIVSNIQLNLLNYFGRRYDAQLQELVVQKTGNRDAAIKALKHLDASIKQELEKGETFFVPYKDMFERYAQALKK